jgi:hypothetical protein
MSLDNTVWVKNKIGGLSGKNYRHQTFKYVASPTGHAKRRVMNGVVSIAFLILLMKKF